ncbi:DUF6377 domain-containing protein [Halosquirtibacter xylanolyticus]|uniref:DUF6377 domain-containing protein n=1 Tax=Halosquirtibacter xylanolyticus TaxID=3374599 RepID=UPI0037479817|nr:DUF6377 domain-containing protein [Prolixibacteraceae bacterium]
MKNLPLLFALLLSSCHTYKDHHDHLEALLLELDSVLDQRDHYIHKKELQLDSLRLKYFEASLQEEKYYYGHKLFNEYLKYDHDSAKYYFEANKVFVLKDSIHHLDHMIDEVSLLSTVGMYNECASLISKFHKQPIPEDLQYRYGKMREFYFEGLIAFSNDQNKLRYKDSLEQVYSSLVVHLKSKPVLIEDIVIRKLFHEEKWEKVLERIDTLLKRLVPSSNHYAMTMYMKAVANKHLQKTDKYIECLIKTSIVDIKSATKEYMSLGDLAWSLYELGDVKRAYQYAQIAIHDANQFKAKQHAMQIARILPIIDNAYSNTLQKEKRIIYGLLIMVTLSTFVFAFLLMLLRRKTNRIVELKDSIEKSNEALVSSDKLKDRYIGYFIHQCSDYIIKLTQLKQTIHKNMRDKRYDEVMRITSEYRKVTAETEELYRKFDTAFLYLYPDFPTQLNALFADYTLDSGQDGLLGPQQRICALIRVGIDESAAIANFLGYSVNTIYAYRTKMRNHAKDRGHFEQQILSIGHQS